MQRNTQCWHFCLVSPAFNGCKKCRNDSQAVMVAVASKQKSILSPKNIRIKLCTASRGAYIFFIPVFFFWSVVCQQNEYFQSINTKLMQLYWCSRRRWKVVNADTDTGGIVYEFHYDGHLVRRVEADFVQKKKGNEFLFYNFLWRRLHGYFISSRGF